MKMKTVLRILAVGLSITAGTLAVVWFGWKLFAVIFIWEWANNMGDMADKER